MDIGIQARMLAARAIQNQDTPASVDKDRLAKTARDFEAIFVQQVFKEMRKTIPEGGLLPRGQAEDIYFDMQDMEAAKQLARQGGIGLADMMLEQLQKK